MLFFQQKKPRRFHYTNRYGSRANIDFHAGLHAHRRQRTVVLVVLLVLLLILLSLG